MLPDSGVLSLEHDGPPGHVELWWGPVTRVQPGDKIRCFPTSMGIMVEAVDSDEIPPPFLPPPA